MDTNLNTPALSSLSISDIADRRDAMAEAVRRFRAGVDSGDFDDWSDGDENCADRVILESRHDREVTVYLFADREVAVGDVNGLISVDVSPCGEVGGAMTTRDTITTSQIEALRSEAASAGDEAGVILCDAALDGDETAVDAVVQMIQNAEAMVD